MRKGGNVMSNSVKAIAIAIITIACIAGAYVVNVILEDNYTFPESFEPLVMFLIFIMWLVGLFKVVKIQGPSPRQNSREEQPRQNRQIRR